MATTATLINLDDLDTVAPCSVGFEFEYILPNGEGSNVFLTVLGTNADELQEWNRREANKMRRQTAAREMEAARNRNKVPEIRKFEDDEEFGLNATVEKVIGWRNVQQEFSRESLLKFCKRTPEVVKQISDASENVANFIKGK